jgi:hypothetical protein
MVDTSTSSHIGLNAKFTNLIRLQNQSGLLTVNEKCTYYLLWLNKSFGFGIKTESLAIFDLNCEAESLKWYGFSFGKNPQFNHPNLESKRYPLFKISFICLSMIPYEILVILENLVERGSKRGRNNLNKVSSSPNNKVETFVQFGW